MMMEFHSQYGEDEILNKIFGKKIGFCIEVGGFDGVKHSNTYFFEKLGWQCIIIEPIPYCFDKILKNRKCQSFNLAISDFTGVSEFYVAKSVEEISSFSPDIARFQAESTSEFEKIMVQTTTLNSILEKMDSNPIDFITIDVEGHEMNVLHGFDIEKYNPKIVIIEDNSNGKEFAVKNYLRKYGYTLFKRTGCNDWYTNDAKLYNFKELFFIKLIFLKYKLYHSTPLFLLRIYRHLKSFT
ncbi:FkbM family methyltransferase [Aquirufa sp.]|jgi:FkbM family methyltransferase|uniref:FkbM family methyltransferase n=1 Tax=Aquirufa sp. TaxID=2676249 RepID=UPI0037C09D1E